MFTTGFTMNPVKVAESMQGKTVEWMKTLAKAKKRSNNRKCSNRRSS
jgi:hypothetical protein